MIAYMELQDSIEYLTENLFELKPTPFLIYFREYSSCIPLHRPVKFIILLFFIRKNQHI